ncbi:MAG: PA14 domain-containing protein, partial [Candidatus Magasanikbacteria bacterium]|nr:PA14 domain-containing protein [Candidatus Magasanikbacteria bacterium]
NDGLPPQLTNVEVPYVSGTLAFVSWDTNENGTSVVQYSEDESYKLTAQSGTRVKEHQVILKNLKVNTEYRLRVSSVDEDGNKSSLHYKTFKTAVSTNVEKEDLKVQNFRPATVSDVLVGTDQFTLNFKTNHYAKGSVSVTRSGFRTQTQQLPYNSTHQATFTGLTADSEYKVTYSMVDVFNKKVSGSYTVNTKKAGSNTSTSASSVSTAVTGSSTSGSSVSPASSTNSANASSGYCNQSTLNSVGYYGQYYNFPNNYKGINDAKNSTKGLATGWYDSAYLAFGQVDTDLHFKNKLFLPIDEKTFSNDPFYFAVSWRAILEVPKDTNYKYEIGVDNSGWVYIDGKLVSDMGELKPFQSDTNSVRLTAGFHYLEIYYADRGPGQAAFRYTASSDVIPHPWPENCSLKPGGYAVGSASSWNPNLGNTGNTGNTNSGDGNIVVAGDEFSLYTNSTALLKTYASPDIYTIMNGQRHFISSPASFNEYGYDWMKVRTVSQAELEKYPRARLIKSGTGNTIYYLFQKPEGQWLKINLGSPSVFASYPANYWGNVISVTQLDVDSYPDVKLIKTKDNSEIYYLENNERHVISNETFIKRGYNKYEICEVNNTHLESYKISTPLK